MPEVGPSTFTEASFKDGDISSKYKSSMEQDVKALEGMWEEMKDISESSEAILKNSGVSWVKRTAMKATSLKTLVKVKKVDADGNPTMYMKSFYPLGITKDTEFTANGSDFEQDDSADTCVWTVKAKWVDGRLVQKRVGSKGTMYDVRCVLDKHPAGKTTEKPVMCFLWTLIDAKGEKHTSEQWFKRTKEIKDCADL